MKNTQLKLIKRIQQFRYWQLTLKEWWLSVKYFLKWVYIDNPQYFFGETGQQFHQKIRQNIKKDITKEMKRMENEIIKNSLNWKPKR